MNKLTLDDIKALEARHIVQTYKRQPVAFDALGSAKGPLAGCTQVVR